jgi:toxin ParE1/3/4
LAELHLARRADADIDDLLDWSESRFGREARERYATLLETALADIAADPVRPGSRSRPELGANRRSYHLRYSQHRAKIRAGFVSRPRHAIYYRVVTADLINVERVLHDAMDVGRHLPTE